jgi:hypothetical protein
MRRLPALVVGLAVFAVAGAAATVSQHQPRLPLAPAAATRAAIRGIEQLPAADRRGLHWDRTTVTAVDDQLERVSFYEGARIVAESAVRADGTIKQTVNFNRLQIPYGDWLAYQPALLTGLALVFVLMTGVAPLWRLRNLDVAATLSLIAPVVLLQYRYVGASVLAAAPGLLYLLARCASIALGAPRRSLPSRPLFEVLTPAWDAARRVRALRLALLAFVLVFVMVGVSSPNAVDVVYAVMEGATKLIHGVLPYGHLPGDVIHGDTYPILSYALYAPVAALAPVNSTWDSVDVALGVGVLATLASAWTLLRAVAGSRRGRAGRREPEAEIAGLRAALSWLAFPPLLITASTGTTDVMLGSMLVFAVVLWRRPAVSSGLLAAAGWFKLAPFALLPVWLAPLRGRRLLAALASIGAVSAAMLGLLVAIGGIHGPSEMIHSISYQFSRGSEQSLWSVLGADRLQSLAEAGVLALIAVGAVRLWRDPELAADRTRVAALAAAILLGLELSADYWSFLYLVWVVPLLCLSALGDGVLLTVVSVSRAPAASRRRALVPALSR